MKLYHGSNVEIIRPDLARCRPYKDFGKGFYTTTYPDQAEKMAKRASRIYGGEPVINAFEIIDNFLENSGLRIKRFDRPDENWAAFVMNNRNKSFKDFANPACNLDAKYDIVEGPVANDNLVTLLNLYVTGTITMAALKSEMTYRQLTNQISFHTEKALELLIKCEV